MNLSSNLENKIDSVTQRMNQQPQRANNATMSTAPSCESSPCLPSDWSTFRVSLLKLLFTWEEETGVSMDQLTLWLFNIAMV